MNSNLQQIQQVELHDFIYSYIVMCVPAHTQCIESNFIAFLIFVAVRISTEADFDFVTIIG